MAVVAEGALCAEPVRGPPPPRRSPPPLRVRFLAAAVGLALGGSAAATPSGDEVLAAARAVSASVKDKSMRVRMRIVAPDGSERVRLLRGYEKKTENGRRILWIFESPAELAGTGFLAWQERDEPDHLWVYFPGQRRVRQVPPQLRREHFQGSAFTFEDLTAVFYLDYGGEHLLEREESCEGARCQLVLTRLPAGEYAYREMRSWVRADDHVPVRIEFFDDALLKVLRVLRTERIEGVPTVVEMEMESPRDSYRTRVEFSEVDYNQELDDSLFTLGSLSKTGK
jgi:outer membrane lipoprotein-sorting protein